MMGKENSSFEVYEKKLLEIYSMSEGDYFSKLNKDKCYTVEYSKKISTIDVIKNRIDSFLSEKKA